ncbi:MAG: hypothetical protein CMJ85_13780 [Planctomycetes bacterium]|jgi:hypothetical protein|nr:hypothetical protein [Planctomycetota bacterium]
MKTALTLVLLTASCGYTHGFHAPERLGIRTVAVLTVSNETFRQGLDTDLTRQLGRDLTHFTGLVPGGPGSADARLEVTLREVAGRPVTEQGGGALIEGAIMLAAEVRLVEQRSGRVLYEGKHLDWAAFRATVGETLSSALSESIADLSRKILITMDGRFPGNRRSATRPDPKREPSSAPDRAKPLKGD